MMRLIFHKKHYLLINQFQKIHKAFANGSKANINFSKTQLSKMVQLEGLGPFPLIWVFLTP